MKAPKCHGQSMERWTKDDGSRCWQVWRCGNCGKELDLYRWPWTWFWLTADRCHLMDEAVSPKWWLGAMGSWRGFAQCEITFTIMPFNFLIDQVVRLWSWLRYRQKNRWGKALEDAYRRGLVDGRAQQRIRFRKGLAEAGWNICFDETILMHDHPIILYPDGRVAKAD